MMKDLDEIIDSITDENLNIDSGWQEIENQFDSQDWEWIDADSANIENILEFPLGDEEDYVSLLYHMDTDKWGCWYIDDEGEEVEKYFDSFTQISNGIQVYDQIVTQEEIIDIKNIVDEQIKNRK